jgi:hypothetical protein
VLQKVLTQSCEPFHSTEQSPTWDRIRTPTAIK